MPEFECHARPHLDHREGRLARTELSTIRRYVEALGGRIEVVAEFGDQRLVLG
jgi:hypothetical protein